MEMSYDDVSIWIESDTARPGRLRVRAQTPAGSASDTFDPDGLVTPLEGLTTPAGPMRSITLFVGGRSLDNPDAIGSRLFRALFSGRVGTLFFQSCGPRLAARRGVRLRLCFDPTQEGVAPLVALPWELLYREETRDLLSLDRRTPVVRAIEVPRGAEPPPFTPPLKVLLVSSSPADCAPLDLERECQLIEEAWRMEGTAEVRVLEKASPESLHQALEGTGCHVLHFMGHGDFDSRTGLGTLLLEDQEQTTQPLCSRVLARLLQSRDIRLAVLNACQSGRTPDGSRADFFAGVATALLLGGIPAALSMRAPVSDSAMLAFSKAFHRNLALGAPVEAAVSEGRLAIYRDNPEALEWTTPILFLRTPDGHLFRREPQEEARPQTSEQPDVVCIQGDEIEAERALIANQIGSGTASSTGRIEVQGRRVNLAGATIANRKLTSR